MRDEKLYIHVHEAIINTPARLRRTLHTAIGDNKANIIMGRPRAGAISVIDSPVVTGMSANVLWQSLNPNGGTLVLELEYAYMKNAYTGLPNVQEIPPLLHTWMMTPHDGG